MAKLLARLRQVLLIAVLLAAVTYGVDYGILRYRVSANKSAFDTVTVKQVYAVPRNDHKLEYMSGDPQDQTCVNSLFPHLGDPPCWYLRAHTKQRIDL
jgi:hypothetical protein